MTKFYDKHIFPVIMKKYPDLFNGNIKRMDAQTISELVESLFSNDEIINLVKLELPDDFNPELKISKHQIVSIRETFYGTTEVFIKMSFVDFGQIIDSLDHRFIPESPNKMVQLAGDAGSDQYSFSSFYRHKDKVACFISKKS